MSHSAVRTYPSNRPKRRINLERIVHSSIREALRENGMPTSEGVSPSVLKC